MELTVKSGGVPPGNYQAKFAGVESGTNDLGKHLVWKFDITSGSLKGQIASRITQPGPTLKNACGKMLQGILGRHLQDGEKVDLANFVGKNYLIIIQPTDKGGTRIEAVSPAD